MKAPRSKCTESSHTVSCIAHMIACCTLLHKRFKRHSQRSTNEACARRHRFPMQLLVTVPGLHGLNGVFVMDDRARLN